MAKRSNPLEDLIARRPARKATPRKRSKPKIRYVETKRGLVPIESNRSQAAVQRDYNAYRQQQHKERVHRAALRRRSAKLRRQKRAFDKLPDLAKLVVGGNKVRLTTQAEQLRGSKAQSVKAKLDRELKPKHSFKGTPEEFAGQKPRRTKATAEEIAEKAKPRLVRRKPASEAKAEKVGQRRALKRSPASIFADAFKTQLAQDIKKDVTRATQVVGTAASLVSGAPMNKALVELDKPKDKAAAKRQQAQLRQMRPHLVSEKEAKTEIKGLAKNINRPFGATGKGVQRMLQGKNPAKGAAEGWKNPEKTDWKDIFGNTLGMKKLPGGKVATGIAGTAGNLILDPLNIPSGGTAAIAKATAVKATRKLVQEAGEEAAKAGAEAAAKRAGAEAAEKVGARLRKGVVESAKGSVKEGQKQAEKTAERVERARKQAEGKGKARAKRDAAKRKKQGNVGNRPPEHVRRAARRASSEAEEVLNKHVRINVKTGEKQAGEGARAKAQRVTPEAQERFAADKGRRAAEAAEKTRKHGSVIWLNGEKVRAHGEGQIKGESRKLRRKLVKEAGGKFDENGRIVGLSKGKLDEIEEAVTKDALERYELLEKAVQRATANAKGRKLKGSRRKIGKEEISAPVGGYVPARYKTLTFRTIGVPAPTLKGDGLRTGLKIGGKEVRLTRRKLDAPVRIPWRQERLAREAVEKARVLNRRNISRARRGVGAAAAVSRAAEDVTDAVKRNVDFKAKDKAIDRNTQRVRSQARSEFTGSEREGDRVAGYVKRLERLAHKSGLYKTKKTGKLKRAKITEEGWQKLYRDIEEGVENPVTRAARKLEDMAGELKAQHGIDSMLDPGAKEGQTISERIVNLLDGERRRQADRAAKHTGTARLNRKEAAKVGGKGVRAKGKQEKRRGAVNEAEALHRDLSDQLEGLAGESDELRRAERQIDLKLQKAETELKNAQREHAKHLGTAKGAKRAGPTKREAEVAEENVAESEEKIKDLQKEIDSLKNDREVVRKATINRAREGKVVTKETPKADEELLSRGKAASREEARPVKDTYPREEARKLSEEIDGLYHREDVLRRNVSGAKTEAERKAAKAELAHHTKVLAERERELAALTGRDEIIELRDKLAKLADDHPDVNSAEIPGYRQAQRELAQKEKELQLRINDEGIERLDLPEGYTIPGPVRRSVLGLSIEDVEKGLASTVKRVEELHAKPEWTATEALEAQQLHATLRRQLSEVEVLNELKGGKAVEEYIMGRGGYRRTRAAKKLDHSADFTKQKGVYERGGREYKSYYKSADGDVIASPKKGEWHVFMRDARGIVGKGKTRKEALDAAKKEYAKRPKLTPAQRAEELESIKQQGARLRGQKAQAERTASRRQQVAKSIDGLVTRARRVVDNAQEVAERHGARIDEAKAKIAEGKAERKTLQAERHRLDVESRKIERRANTIAKRLAREEGASRETERFINELGRSFETAMRRNEKFLGKADIRQSASQQLDDFMARTSFTPQKDEKYVVFFSKEGDRLPASADHALRTGGSEVLRGTAAYSARMRDFANDMEEALGNLRHELEGAMQGAKQGTIEYALAREYEAVFANYDKVVASMRKYLDKLDEAIETEAQHHLHRFTEGEIAAARGKLGFFNPARKQFDQAAMEKGDDGARLITDSDAPHREQTKVAKAEVRKQRLTAEEENIAATRRGEAPPYDISHPLDSLRLGVTRDLARVALYRFLTKFFETGRVFKGQEIAAGESLWRRVPGRGFQRIGSQNNMVEGTVGREALKALKNGEDVRIFSRDELAWLDNHLRPPNASGNRALRLYYNARSFMTQAWVTWWPGSWTRNLAGDTFNQILGGAGPMAILTGWRTTLGATVRHMGEARVLPISKKDPRYNKLGQRVARKVARLDKGKVTTETLQLPSTTRSKLEVAPHDRAALDAALLQAKTAESPLASRAAVGRARVIADRSRVEVEAPRQTTRRVDNRRKFRVVSDRGERIKSVLEKDKDGNIKLDKNGNAKFKYIAEPNSRYTYRTRDQVLSEAYKYAVTGGFVGGELGGVFGRKGLIARAAAVREMGPRVGSFIEHRRMMGTREAIERTNRYHFDYQDLTRAEKHLRNGLFPFFTWTSRNLRLQLGEALRHPGAYVSLKRVMDMQAQEAGYKDAWSALKSLKPYDIVSLPITVGKGAFISVALPAGVLLNLFSDKDANEFHDARLSLKEVLGNFAEMSVEMLNPVIKVPIELATNKSLFWRKPIKQTQGNSGIGPEIYKPVAPTGIFLFGHKVFPGVQDTDAALRKVGLGPLADTMGVERKADGTYVMGAKARYLFNAIGPEAQFLLNASTKNTDLHAARTPSRRTTDTFLGVRHINADPAQRSKGRRKDIANQIITLQAENKNDEPANSSVQAQLDYYKRKRIRNNKIKSLQSERDKIGMDLQYVKPKTEQQKELEDIAKDLAPENPLAEVRDELLKEGQEIYNDTGKLPPQLSKAIGDLTRRINSAKTQPQRTEALRAFRIKYPQYAPAGKTPKASINPSKFFGVKPAKPKARVSSSARSQSLAAPSLSTSSAPAVSSGGSSYSPPPVTYSKIKSRGTYTASVYGGSTDPSSGTKGYRGDDLTKKWDTWAELGAGGKIGNALGGLPYNTPIRVTYPNGETQILYKRDIGRGGAGIGGKARTVDIWHGAVERAGYTAGSFGLKNVKVELLDRRSKKPIANITSAMSAPAATPAGRALQEQFATIALGGRVDTKALAGALISDRAEAMGKGASEADAVASMIPRDNLSKIEMRADKIAGRNMNYRWGGGHVGSKEALRRYTGPLDCSGAVSKVLGIDPRVSGEFTKWGKAGAKWNRVTIFANSKHVFMWIPGRGFFGTSKANKGGGANWIPRSAISKGYLSGFVARHM